jgi:hypothetical protein
MSQEIVETLLNMMTEEQKAQLIKKLKSSDITDSKPQEPPAPCRLKQTGSQDARVSDDFTMKREKPQQKSIQVEVKKRENLFVDDGTEHKNEANKTPEIVPTARSRPKFEKVEQVCNYCKKSEMVHPQFVREFYTCVRCASGGAGR